MGFERLTGWIIPMIAYRDTDTVRVGCIQSVSRLPPGWRGGWGAEGAARDGCGGVRSALRGRSLRR